MSRLSTKQTHDGVYINADGKEFEAYLEWVPNSKGFAIKNKKTDKAILTTTYPSLKAMLLSGVTFKLRELAAV